MSLFEHLERRWTRMANAGKRPAVNQIVQAIRLMRSDLEEQARDMAEKGHEGRLQDPADRYPARDIALRAVVKDDGDYLKCRVTCPRGGFRELLRSELRADPELGASDFSGTHALIHFTFCVRGLNESL